MIKVVAKHFIKAEKLDEYIELSKQLVEATLKNDRGCVSYALFQDMKDPCIVAMIEEWDSREDADEHLKSDHFLNLVGRLAECSEKPSDINYFAPVK